MQKRLFQQAGKYIRQIKKHRIWSRVVAGMACVVVFATTYMLILPAITMEQTTYCGLEEHKHEETCYENRLICDLEETEGHTHVWIRVAGMCWPRP